MKKCLIAGVDADKPVPAVVIGGHVNGLGVVRSLAKWRVRSVVLDTKRRHAAMWSRWSKALIVNQLYGRRLVDDLLALQLGLGVRPVLILTHEMAVETVSEFAAELSEHYRISLPSPTMVATLANKALFQNFAEAHCLPVPRTVVIEQESDIADLSELSLPVIVKPANKREVYTRNVESICRAGTLQEAKCACRRMLQMAGTLVVQEWIDGPDGNIYFSLFHCGLTPKSRSIFFGRKIASYPPGVGNTAICVAAPEVADLLRPLTEKFIDISEYRGLGSVEFKWDTRAGRFLIIEPTVGRTDWQEEIATLNGVNLPLIAYCYELGVPCPLEGPSAAAVWRESFGYLRNCSDLGSDVPIFDGYWRKDDPLPAVVYYARSAFRGVRAKLLNLAKGE